MKNQIKVGIILSYIYMGLNIIVQIGYTPVMIHLLGQSEYGIYNLVGSFVSYLSLFSLGFSGAYLRFYSLAEKSGDRKRIAKLNGMFLTLFLIMGVAAFVCGIILTQFTNQIFGDKLTPSEMNLAKNSMYILVINIVLTFPSSIFDSIISAHEAFVFQKVVSILGVLFNPLICLPLLLKGYGSISVILVTTFITTIRLITNIFYCLKKLTVPFLFHDFDFVLLKEMGIFSVFLFINMLIDQINWSVDKFILGRVSGAGAVAKYGVGAQINSLVISFSTAISSVFSPRINRIAADGKKNRGQEFTDLFLKVGRIQFMILFLIVSGFVFFGRYFIEQYYAGREYTESYYVALLLIIPEIVPLIQNVGIEMQRAVNKHRARAIVYLLMAIINVFISIPLAKEWGAIGSAIGTTISIVSANIIFMNIYYYRAIGIDVIKFWKDILQLVVAGLLPIVCGGVMTVYLDINSLWSFVLMIMIFSSIYAISMYTIGMNEYEKGMINVVVKKIRFKSK